MMIYSDRHIPVATTPDEFNACWSSGAAFEVSEELAAQMGHFPVFEDVISDEEFFAPPDPDEPDAD